MEPLRNGYGSSFEVDKRAQASGHMLCFHCEEYISRSAHECPYCRTKISHQQSQEPSKILVSGNKITPLVPPDASAELEDSQEKSQLSSVTTYLSALLLLLFGSSAIVLSILFPLLAKDGIVTLSWNASVWMPLLGFGVAFLTIGYSFLMKIEGSPE